MKGNQAKTDVYNNKFKIKWTTRSIIKIYPKTLTPYLLILRVSWCSKRKN